MENKNKKIDLNSFKKYLEEKIKDNKEKTKKEKNTKKRFKINKTILFIISSILFFLMFGFIINRILFYIHSYKIDQIKENISNNISKNLNLKNEEENKMNKYYKLYLESKTKTKIYEKKINCENNNLKIFYKKINNENINIENIKNSLKDCESINSENFSFIPKASANILDSQNIEKDIIVKNKNKRIIKKENIKKVKEIKIEKKETNSVKKIKKEKKVNKKKYDYGPFYNKFLKDMYLEGCRIYQKEEDHMNHGHMYATDIPCIRGKTHEIKAPKLKNVYLVLKNRKDKYLGNYVVLKHGEYRYVFGHTKSNLKEGTRIYPGDHIGYTNISGVSQNYHLHFEVWKNGYNVKLQDENIKNEKYSYKLKKQRNWLTKEEIEKKKKEFINKVADFIISLEGFSSKPYCDNLVKMKNGKYKAYCPTKKERYSIGYGTISYYGEKEITKEEARKRKIEEIKKIIPLVDRSCYNENQKIALISYIYNTGGNQKVNKVTSFKKYVKTCDKKNIEYVMAIYGYNGEGLKKRRKIEKKKYYSK